MKQDIVKNHPIGAYAVDSIEFELGTAVGMNAVGVTVKYSREPEELQSIKPAKDMEKAKALIRDALNQYDSALVMRVENYQDADLVQYIEDFAAENPDVVMENPTVTVAVYPESGADRVVDIRFAYRTSRESLRQMQKYVQPVFTSASLYVSSEEEGDIIKYARLYTFLMERNDYKVDTGTRNGDARCWNIIRDGDYYYHVDLLSPSGFILYKDQQLTGYVWDYSAYPVCGVPQQPEKTEE